MSFLFDGCSSLISLPDISKWNVNNVIDMYCIFYECPSLFKKYIYKFHNIKENQINKKIFLFARIKKN